MTMARINSAKNLWRVAAALFAAGTLFSSSCSSVDVEAIVNALEVAAHQLEQQQQDDDISFGDWLRDELDDL